MNKKACFTGHRPEKIVRQEAEILFELEYEVDRAISEGVTEFITGMARGVDLWAAKIVLKRKEENYNIRLICAVPYNDFPKSWSQKWKKMYEEVISLSDEIYVISDKFSYTSFMKRNRWMIDNSGVVIAVFNGSSGGTANTLSYAERKNKDIRIIKA